MATPMFEKVESLWSSMGEHERRHRHYSRALGWLIWGLLAALLLLVLAMGADRPPAEPHCRQSPPATGFAVPAISLELARSPAQVRGLLQPGADPAARSERCVEARAQAFQAVLTLDNALFIPAYGLLGAAALAWLLALSAHAAARGRSTGTRPDFVKVLHGGLLFALACLLATLFLDASENRAALRVLDRASGQGALLDGALTEWAGDVARMRHASLCKWLACGLWAAALALLAAWMGPVLTHPPGGRRRQKLARTLHKALIAMATAAALCLLIASAAGLVVDAVAGTAAAGASAAATAVGLRWLEPLIAAGFAAFAVSALLMAGLDLTWRWVRRPPGGSEDWGGP